MRQAPEIMVLVNFYFSFEMLGLNLSLEKHDHDRPSNSTKNSHKKTNQGDELKFNLEREIGSERGKKERKSKFSSSDAVKKFEAEKGN